MNRCFELIPMQKMYKLGQEDSVFLGGKYAYLYFSTVIKDFNAEKFETSLVAVLENNSLLLYSIEDICIKNNNTNYLITYQSTEANIYKENQKIADRMCKQFRTDQKPPNLSVRVLQCPDDSAYIHFQFNNMIFDGISIDVFLEQLYQYYRYGTLPETADYADYAESLQRYAKSNKYLCDKQFFEQLYRQFSADEFELPYSVSPEKLKSTYCSFQKRHIERTVYQKLEKIASNNKISIFMLLISIFANVTARFSGAESFYFNVPCSVRPEGTANTVGLYSNFMIVPFVSDNNHTIISNAIANAGRFHAIAQHRMFPGDEAVKLVHRYDRNHASMNMVFTTVPFREKGYPAHEIRFCTNQTILECDIVMLEGEYFVTFSYPEGLYPDHIVNSFADMFVNGCRETAETNGDIRTFTLPERDMQIIRNANRKNTVLADTSLNKIIKEAFLRNADKPFLICNGNVYSYAEILKKAYYLQHISGLSKGKTAILLPKGESQVIALYTALLFSGTYMPIDTSLSLSEICHCLKSAGISQLITNHTFIEKFDMLHDIKLINIDELPTNIPETEDIHAILENIPIHSADSVRIIINTSGTTGNPKSILLKDSSLANCFCNGVRIFGFQQGERLLALTNFGHDMAIFDTLGVIFFGGCIVMPDEREMKEPSAWIKLIETYHISIWQSVPSFMEMLMLQQGNDTPLPSVRRILHGGEFLNPVLAKKIFARFPKAELFNVGGPTETTVWNIFHKVTDADTESGIIPYGFPMSGAEYHLLNRNLEECPVGVKGVMYCMGECLSLGYAGNKEETEKHFTMINEKKAYHTGDIGVRRPDGELLICGREDFQVKIHGKRVELSGIETVLMQYPDILSAVVIYSQEYAKLAAVYTANHDIPESELLYFLRERLPEYMIPKLYIKTSAIPLTKNGKYDRKALVPVFQEYVSQHKAVKTVKQNNIRDSILTVIGEETDYEPAEETMNFFEAGGDSLSAVKITAKVSRMLEKEISVFNLINSETIGEWLDTIL